jgi:hypothetical protein
MLDRLARGSRVAAAHRPSPALLSALAGIFLLAAAPLYAQTTPTVSVGAGVQTSFVHTEPDGGEGTDAFPLDHIRLYVSGTASEKITFMFNTDYYGADNTVGVMDAVAQFAFSPKFNIWAGRFLPPSDRANLYGPFYANHWAVYTDGVEDGYPFIFQGRDNGVMYWGQFDKVKVSGGAFDGATATGDSSVLAAGRVQVDLWDAEAGYYLNGTYYGDKNLLAFGLAGQVQADDKSAWSFDFLLEKKLSDAGGTVTIESEYAKYSKLGGYKSAYTESDGAYILGSYLFPKKTGMGQVQLLGKFAKANYEKGLTRLDTDYSQKTTEINVNYIIKQFNARVMFFFLNTDFSAIERDSKKFGVGIQLQM